MLQVQNIPIATSNLSVTAKVDIYLLLMVLVQGISLQKQADFACPQDMISRTERQVCFILEDQVWWYT